MKNKTAKLIAVITVICMTAGLSGCSKNVINYQVAECIGTLGQYENNEPVETPKMKAERLSREAEEADQQRREDILATAEALAMSYEYESAISYLQNSEAVQGDERAAEAIENYQKQLDSIYEYNGDIGHFCFTNLIVDTKRAFRADKADEYRANMITLQEFNDILDSLYESGYVLIDLYELAEELTDSKGDVTMESRLPRVPNGKKPLIFSVENLDYSMVRNGDGIAVRLALDNNGNVMAAYTDEEGHDLLGPYDVVPALEAFIQEHPDFSYKGARGIIGLSGKNGVFGYQVEEKTSLDYKENQETVKMIAARLAEDGWHFASEGYSYANIGELSYENLKSDITKWKNTVGELVGSCNILMFPNGVEVDYSTEKAHYLINQGYHYLEGMWSDGDHLEVNSSYLRQTRRTVTGYVLENYPGNFNAYFSTASIIDNAR